MLTIDYGPYLGVVVSVHDADTVAIRINCGFSVHVVESFRLHGINAPELRKADPAGHAARDHLLSLIPIGSTVRVTTAKGFARTFTRYVASVEFIDANGQVADVAAAMVASGHARWCGPDLRPLDGPPPPL